MDRGAWQGTAHGVAESDTTEQLTLSLSLQATTCISSWREWDQKKKSKPLSKFFFPRASLLYPKVRGRITEDSPHLAPNHENFSKTVLFLPSPATSLHPDLCNSLFSVFLLPEHSVSNPLFPCNHNSLKYKRNLLNSFRYFTVIPIPFHGPQEARGVRSTGHASPSTWLHWILPSFQVPFLLWGGEWVGVFVKK